jgi:hypothetical protein
MRNVCWIFPFFSNFFIQKNIINDKIILTNYIETIQYNKYINTQNRIEFNILNTYETPLDNAINIYLKNVYEEIKKDGKIIPQYHTFNKFHYQYLYSKYKNQLDYNEYCLLEEKLSDIIFQYIQDNRKISYIFKFQDKNWLDDNSIISYIEQKNQIKRIEFIDLDVIEEPIFGIKDKIYLWNIYKHPKL